VTAVCLCVSELMVNGHSSSTTSTAHVVTTAIKPAGQQRSETRAEPHFQPLQLQRYRSVDSARKSASSGSSLSHDDRPSTETQV